MKRLLFGVAIATLLSTVPLSAGPRGTTSSIILNPPSTQVLAAGTTWTPNLGDWVTFTVSYPKTLDHYGVRIQVLCYQAGVLVFSTSGAYTDSFKLGGDWSTWQTQGGSAECTADLYYWSWNSGQKFNWLSSTSFPVNGN